jgi:hypothetical protein
MKIKLFILITILISVSIEFSWSSPSVFKISAGAKTMEFAESNLEWNDFCLDKKLGCARFKVKKADKINFGMVKIISDQISLRSFDQYCQDAFTESKSIDKNEKGLTTCSWDGKYDRTYIFWKDDITVMVTTSEKDEKQLITTLIGKAKLYEKP